MRRRGSLDVAGRRVRALASGAQFGAGRQSVTFDGRDDQGRPLGAGLYFYRVRTPDQVTLRRFAMLR